MHKDIIDRYWNMIPEHIEPLCEPEPGTSLWHLLWMLEELRKPMEEGKANRWLGFIQGILIERGFTAVQVEREFTRPYFTGIKT